MVLVDAERQGAEALDELIDDSDDAAIAAVTVAELVVGAKLADGGRRAAREAFLADVLEAVSVEEYDLDVAREHGDLLAHVRRSGRPRGAYDLIIAATARARRREVVSADLKGFEGLPEVALRRAG
jgi:tRNA(fMet)-specific endonuclease VapC